MALKLTDKELNKLLDEVAVDLNKSFDKMKSDLKKADDEDEEPMAKDVGGSVPEESSPTASPSASPAPEESAPPPEASAPQDAPQDPAADAGQLTPEALQAEYSKLPPDELMMHLQAAQAAAQALQGAGPGPGPAGGPPAEASAPPEAPPAPPMAMKSEAKMDDLKKAEKAVNAEITSLKEDVEILAKTVKALLDQPIRKAITSVTELNKEEPKDEPKSYSPEQFWVKLRQVAKNPDLKKSEKQLIKDIYSHKVTPEVAAKQLAKLFE